MGHGMRNEAGQRPARSRVHETPTFQADLSALSWRGLVKAFSAQFGRNADTDVIGARMCLDSGYYQLVMAFRGELKRRAVALGPAPVRDDDGLPGSARNRQARGLLGILDTALEDYNRKKRRERATR